MSNTHLHTLLLGVRMALAGVLKSLDAVLSELMGPSHAVNGHVGNGPVERPDNGPDSCPDNVTGLSSLLSSQNSSPENVEEKQERVDEDSPLSCPDNGPDTLSGQRSPYDCPDKRDGLRKAMAAAWDGCGGTTLNGINRGRIADCAPLLRRLATEQGRDPVELFTAAVGRFKRDAAVIQKRLGFAVFMSQLEVWCAEPAASEENRNEQIRKLKLQLAEARSEMEMAASDVRRAQWERRAGKIAAALEQMGSAS